MTETGKGDANTHCKLLKLPGELRNRIYRLAVVQRNAIEVHCLRDCKISLRHPGLASACRQLYREVEPIFYEENVFRLVKSSYGLYSGGGCVTTLCSRMGPSAANVKELEVARYVYFKYNPARAASMNTVRISLAASEAKPTLEVEVQDVVLVERLGMPLSPLVLEARCTCEPMRILKNTERIHANPSVFHFATSYMNRVTDHRSDESTYLCRVCRQLRG